MLVQCEAKPQELKIWTPGQELGTFHSKSLTVAVATGQIVHKKEFL